MSLRLKVLFGLEHDFFGIATAGESFTHQWHLEWRIPSCA